MNPIFNDVAIGHWVADRCGEQWCDGKGSTIGFERDGQLVVGFVFYDLNGRTVWIGVAAEGSFASPEAFNIVADYCFRQLGVDWVRCKVAVANTRSVQLIESVGFEKETTLHDSHPTGDEVIYRMSKTRCQWLNLEQSKSDWNKPKH